MDSRDNVLHTQWVNTSCVNCVVTENTCLFSPACPLRVRIGVLVCWYVDAGVLVC